MTSISCTGCGGKVSEIAPFCPRCLKPIASSRAEPSPPKAHGSGIGPGTLLLLNLVILFGFLFAVAVLIS